MATFTFRAIDEQSNILSGRYQAEDEADLERRLNMQGLTLIESARSGFFDFGKLNAIRFRLRDLADFTYFLHLIISSGMPIVSGLADLMKNQDNGKVSAAAELIHQKLESGMSVSDALQECPGVFPDYYVAMIRAGETAGSLEQVLTDLMGYIEWQLNFRKTVSQAIVYPLLVLGAVTLLITVLFTFVFPRLVTILVGLKVDLPLATKIIIGTASLFKNYFLFFLGGLFLGIMLLRFWLSTYDGRRRFDSFVLSLPLIGGLIKKIYLSKYCRALATLHSAGLNVERTFTIASGVVRNAVLSESLTVVTDSIIGGENIAQSMEKTGVFPSIVVDMVAIGEKTGNLDSAVKRASEIFDKEVPETLKKVFSYLEPAIIILLGVLVLVVLLSIFLPIYKIVGGIRVR
jgi:type II secretory pathway component PulF